MDTQACKERASCLAARRGMSLFVSDHHVFGVHADGSTILICGSSNPHEVWAKACAVLTLDRDLRKLSRYSLSTPSGTFEAPTWWQLLWRWSQGHRAPLPTVDR